MDEAEFWLRLEGRICRELQGFADRRLRYWWCDGLDPERFELGDGESGVSGRAWFGPDGQDNWRFTLLLGSAVTDRAAILWAALLPGDGMTG